MLFITVPLSANDFNNELDVVKQIAVNNMYDVSLIINILRMKLKGKAENLVYSSQMLAFIKLIIVNYLVSTNYKTSNLMSNKFNHKVTFYCTKNMERMLVNNKDTK